MRYPLLLFHNCRLKNGAEPKNQGKRRQFSSSISRIISRRV